MEIEASIECSTLDEQTKQFTHKDDEIKSIEDESQLYVIVKAERKQ